MKLTWYGHSAFRIDIEGASILIDPFLSGNETCPVSVEEASKGITHILLSHGHSDHVGDAIAIAKKTGAALTANFEICMWAEKQGVKNIKDLNPGGERDLGAFNVALTVAHHTSSIDSENSPLYAGVPCGLIIVPKNGPTLYHAGDTDIFSDMKLIEEFYRPQIGLLPIGDVYTMGGAKAAYAAKNFFNFDAVLPMHYATFDVLDKTPDKFVSAMAGNNTKVLTPKPGEAIDFGYLRSNSATRGAA